MKKTRAAAVIAIFALLMLTVTACVKSEFGMTENTGKMMTITAENADSDATFTSGSLEVADGEQIVISADLSKGTIRVELFSVSEEQDIDTIPQLNGEAVLWADLSNSDGTSAGVPAGTYMLRATCLEKATGTVDIEVKPASQE